jgi:hypothetical protein
MVVMAIGEKRRGKVDTLRIGEFLSIFPGFPSSCPTIGQPKVEQVKVMMEYTKDLPVSSSLLGDPQDRQTGTSYVQLYPDFEVGL